MKKVSILFISALTLGMVFTSCNKDDDDSPAAPSIEGKWVMAKEGMIMEGQEFLSNYENECSTKSDFIALKAGGVADEAYHTSECVEELSTGTWAKEGNNLTVAFDGESVTTEIVTLDASTLKVKFTEPETSMTVVMVFNRG